MSVMHWIEWDERDRGKTSDPAHNKTVAGEEKEEVEAANKKGGRQSVERNSTHNKILVKLRESC